MPLERHCEVHNKTFIVYGQIPCAVAISPSFTFVPSRLSGKKIQTQMPLERHCEAHKKYSSSTEKSLAPWQSPLCEPSCLPVLVAKKSFCISKKNLFPPHQTKKVFFSTPLFF
jgi:hypothetical protein